MNKEIEIPDGYKARIEGNKVILEPKVSEDERIMKAISYAIAIATHDNNTLIYGVTQDEAYSWLERQKEQKPVDYDHEMWKNCEVNFEGGKKEVINNPEKYGLYRPAEWNGDIRNWKNIAYYVLKEWNGIGQYLDNPVLDEIAKELQKRYGPVSRISTSKTKRGG